MNTTQHLIQNYKEIFMPYAVKVCGFNKHIAADVLQDAMVKVTMKYQDRLDEYDEMRSRGYIKKAIYTTYIDTIRIHKGQGITYTLLDDVTEVPDEMSVEDILIEKEEEIIATQELEFRVENMNPAISSVLKYYVEGLTAAQIAEKQGVCISTVLGRIKCGKRAVDLSRPRVMTQKNTKATRELVPGEIENRNKKKSFEYTLLS